MLRFRSRSSFLAGGLLLAACGESPVTPPEAPVGTLRVTATTSGPGTTPTQLQLVLGSGEVMQISASGSQTIEGLPAGDLTARVVVPGHCSADHYAPRTVEITQGGVSELSWSLRCPLPVSPGISTSRWGDPWVSSADGSGGRSITGNGTWATSHSTLNRARTRLAVANYMKADLAFSDVDLPTQTSVAIENVRYLDWSPDGQQLLVIVDGMAAAGGTLLLVWADGVVERTIRSAAVRSARWAPDGRRIAYREGAYIFVEDLQTGVRLNTQHIQTNNGGGEPAWSPDGSRIAFIDLYQPSIRVMNADGSNLRVLTNLTSTYLNTNFGGIDWGQNDLLLMTMNIPPSNLPFPHVIPSGGGDLVPLVDDGGAHRWPRWAP